MKNIFILFDCPLKTCDKLWLYTYSKKYGNVKAFGVCKKTSKLELFIPKLRIGKLLTVVLFLFQCIQVLFVSKKNDLIIAWNYKQGLILSELCQKFKISRYIVSFNWIFVPKLRRNKVLNALHNENFIPVINSRKLENEISLEFNLEKWNGFFIPDTYNDSDSFYSPQVMQEKYVFAGGRNNRDWNILFESAEKLPNVKFKIVISKEELSIFKDLERHQLKNLELYNEISETDYYQLLRNSYLVVCPLKEDRVSGLINIIKAFQYGKVCISTNLGAASLYYPDSLKKKLLYENNNLKDCIEYWWNISSERYIENAIKLQEYLVSEFSPEVLVDNLFDELKKRGWL